MKYFSRVLLFLFFLVFFPTTLFVIGLPDHTFVHVFENQSRLCDDKIWMSLGGHCSLEASVNNGYSHSATHRHLTWSEKNWSTFSSFLTNDWSNFIARRTRTNVHPKHWSAEDRAQLFLYFELYFFQPLHKSFF